MIRKTLNFLHWLTHPEKYNDATAFGFGGQPLSPDPTMPPELIELINQSLDIEPENWIFYANNNTTNVSLNKEMGVEVRWQNGVAQLTICYTNKCFGRPVHWAQATPWSSRGKLVKRLRTLRSQRWQQKLLNDLGRSQASMQVRNAGKPEGELPTQVIEVPAASGMMAQAQQAAVGAPAQLHAPKLDLTGQVSRSGPRKSLLSLDPGIDPMNYASPPPLTATEVLIRQEVFIEKMKQLTLLYKEGL